MDNNKTQNPLDDSIKNKIRQRFLFSAISVSLYSLFALSYTSVGAFLREPISDTNPVSWALLLFAGLIVAFLLLEFIFLQANKPSGES